MGKKSRIATGTNIEERAEKMRKSVLGIDVGGKRWATQTAKGTVRWTYWMEIVMPYINGGFDDVWFGQESADDCG